MPQLSDSKKRNTIILITICSLIFIIAISYSIYNLIYRSDKIEVGIYYAPFIARVEIDNQPVKNNKVTWLTPGSHHLRATLDNFSDVDLTVEVTKDTDNLYGQLLPANAEGERIMAQYQSDYNFINALTSASSIELGEQNRQTWPIISALPIKNALFSIGYSISNDRQLTIFVNADTTYLNDAVNLLKSHTTTDHPIAKYNITFPQWKNPLDQRLNPSTTNDPQEFLSQTYQNITVDNLTIRPGQYSSDNNYYYTTITTGLTEHYNFVTYRAILIKKDNSWQLISTPQPIATTYNSPEVNIDILNAVNNL